MLEKQKLSIILPVKDPEPFLSQLKEEIMTVLNKFDALEYEILVQKEQGLTNAVIAGVKKAQYNTILVMDADGQHSPSYIPQMLTYVEMGFDLVVGSRADYDGLPKYRQLISKTFNTAALHCSNTKLHDSMSGFVMGKKEHFLQLKPSQSYKFLLQLLNLKTELSVKEVPIIFHKRKAGVTKANYMTGLRAAGQIVRLNYHLLPVMAAFLFSLALALVYLKPVGADIHFHWQIAQAWSQFQIGMVSDVALQMNQMPYPPLLHLVLAPSFWFGLQNQWTLLLQVVLLPLCVFTVIKTTGHLGKLWSMLAGFLVLGSFAFIDRLIQVQPQAFTMVLFPLAFYYRHAPDKFAIISVLMILTHGFVAVPLIAGLWLFRLLNNRSLLKQLSLVVLTTLPITLPSLLMIVGGVGHFFGSSYENSQEALVWSSPTFTLLYMRLLLVGFPIFIYQYATTWNGHKLSLLEHESMVALSSMVLLFVWQADRFLQFSTIPLTFLLVSYIKKSRPNIREAFFWVTIVVFLVMYLSIWLMLAGNGFDVR